MSHGDKEGIVDTGVGDIAKETSQESTHDVQVAKVVHKVTLLGKVVEVSGQFDNLGQVMVAILVIGCTFNPIDERDKVLVSDRKLVK